MGIMGSDLPSAEARAQRRLGLGVVIRDGDVLAWSRTVVQVLGPLAGAQAGDRWPGQDPRGGDRGRRDSCVRRRRAAAALGARGSKPFAYVVFPDGTLYQSELTDKRVAARAQADVLRFNVLAARGDIALRRKVRQGVSLARCR